MLVGIAWPQQFFAQHAKGHEPHKVSIDVFNGSTALALAS